MAVTVQTYYQLSELLGDATIDLDGHSFKIALMTPSFTFSATDTSWTGVSANEIANGNGYTTGGQVLVGVTWDQVAGVATFDFTDPEWTATGGSISNVAHAVIYDDTAAGDPLMFALDLGGTFAATAGARLVLQLSSTGLFRLRPTP